jgi:ABC-type transporter Mla subunit MlaD
VQATAWRQSAAQLRTLNTATSPIEHTVAAASLAAIDPPSQLSLASSESRQDAEQFRSNFAHFLRDSCTSTQRAKEALQSMGKYLHNSKAEVDANGRASVLLDQHVIMNYVMCEDLLISYDPEPTDTTDVLFAASLQWILSPVLCPAVGRGNWAATAQALCTQG